MQVVVADGLDHLAAHDAVEPPPALGEHPVVDQLERDEPFEALLTHFLLGQGRLLHGQRDAVHAAPVLLRGTDADAPPAEANVEQRVLGPQRLETREEGVNFTRLGVLVQDTGGIDTWVR